MYYPVGWNKVLKVDTKIDDEVCKIISIQANHHRNLLLILTPKSIHIWNARPQIEIVSHKRSADSITKVGLNESAIWKTDSSVIVVATDYNQLLFYQIRERILSSSSSILMQGPLHNLYNNHQTIYRIRKDPKKPLTETKEDYLCDENIPALSVFLFVKIDLSYIGISCLMSAEEELIVASKNGDIYGVFWNGTVDETLPWSISNNIKKDTHVIDLKFSSVLGGFSAVFSNGEVGFIPLQIPESKEDTNSTNQYNKIHSKINFLPLINNAMCTEINHKYRLVAFGLKDSQVCVCNIGDSISNINENHRLKLPLSKFPHIQQKLGTVNCMRYSPDNLALVTCWSEGRFALWSVFGSLLFFSSQWDTRPCPTLKVFALSWGLEGYNLFLGVEKRPDKRLDNDAASQPEDKTNGLLKSHSIDSSASSSLSSAIFNQEEILVLSLARSALLLSPNTTCLTDSVLLISEDKLFIGQSAPHCHKFDHWLDIDIPQSYLQTNYPIRYATTDQECENVVIAGIHGFSIFSISQANWKSYDNEKNKFCVTGDLIWWNDYLILSCYNMEIDGFEIRAYNITQKLINNSYISHTTSQEVIRMSLFENRLLALYTDGTMGMFMLNLRKVPSPKKPLARSNSTAGLGKANGIQRGRAGSFINHDYPLKGKFFTHDVTLQIAPIDGLVVSNLLANPYCITSVALTRLHFKNHRSDDSILLNACGKLFLLEREVSTSVSSSSPTSDLGSDSGSRPSSGQQSTELEKRLSEAKTASNHMHFASASLKNTPKPSNTFVAFKTVTMIATNVEHYWISPNIAYASDLSYFKKSLWLYCGGLNHDLEVWLPLLNDKNDPPNPHQYTPDRIMLRIRCNTYPLAIKSSTTKETQTLDDTIILGAENDILYGDSQKFTVLPFYTVKRQCQVYLHRILLELLKRNLGYYAQKIAENCQSLPYFAHSFELLLHEVLEEEATSPKPIPDPMLPQVVEFIRQFPVYLKTVVHCARKSELAMWPHLFSIVGNPRKLFQDCLESGNLNIAASCLIILQSFDRQTVSQQMVKELINSVQKDPKYQHLINDLETFFVRAELDILAISGDSQGPQKK